MPWTMVEASDVPRVRSYRTGRGIPDLVLLDGETGEVIKTSYTDAGRFTGPTAVLEETERRLGE
jgi:hypothetical protein